MSGTAEYRHDLPPKTALRGTSTGTGQHNRSVDALFHLACSARRDRTCATGFDSFFAGISGCMHTSIHLGALRNVYRHSLLE